MGVLGNRNAPKEKPVYTEKKIQKLLRNYFMSPGAIKYRIENLNVYDWESDSISVTRSGYVYECEIKISKADFNNDKKKVKKHQILEGTYKPRREGMPYPMRPNYFYYVVPEGMITKDDLPEYAGLMYVNETWPYVHIEVPAPQIHKDKIDEEKLKLKDKFYYNYISWKYKAESDYEDTIEDLRKQLRETKFDDEGNHYKYNIAEANKWVKVLEQQIELGEQKCDSYYDMYQQERRYGSYMEDFMLSKGISKEEIRQKAKEFRLGYDKDEWPKLRPL